MTKVRQLQQIYDTVKVLPKYTKQEKYEKNGHASVGSQWL